MTYNLLARCVLTFLGIFLAYTTLYGSGNSAHRALVDHGLMGWVALATMTSIVVALLVDTSFCVLKAKAACQVTQPYRYQLWMALSLVIACYAVVMIKNRPDLLEVLVWTIYALVCSGMALYDLLNCRTNNECKIEP